MAGWDWLPLELLRGLGFGQHMVRDNTMLVGLLPGMWDYQQPSWKRCTCGHKQPAASGPQAWQQPHREGGGTEAGHGWENREDGGAQLDVMLDVFACLEAL